MIAEIGHYALVLALGVALIQAVVPLAGTIRGDLRLAAVGRPAALVQGLLVALAFAALMTAYVRSDFSLLNVVQNSHSQQPLLYKITGVWGNHEGSMLLWVLILAIFGAAVAAFGRNLPERLAANVLSVQAMVSVAFLLFILLTSNPFTRVSPAPLEGNSLNPVLQDIGLAIHPVLLYLGYVGFSISFAFAAAALIEGKIDAAWARWVRPWTLAAWIFLTLGIAMGSYWAYYELGWGGWWFWDPVENASFLPWLAGTALLHSAVVMEKRNALKIWTILLAILTFSLSLLGTFLVRSGVLTSVHTFASDPTRGVFILVILAVFIGGGLALFAWRASLLQQGGIFAPISREGGLVFNNLFLTAACGTVLVGTLYPLALEALTGDKISVGPPFFNLTFGPLMVPLLVAVPFGPLLAWKRGDLYAAGQRLLLAFSLALVAVLLVLWLVEGAPVLAALGIGLAVWLMVGAFAEIVRNATGGGRAWAKVWPRLTGLPRSVWGTALAHFGVGATLLGIGSVTAFETESIHAMQPGDSVDIAGYTVTFDGASARQGPNYQALVADMTVTRNGRLVAEMAPEKRVYPARQTGTSESAIHFLGFTQLYVALGDQDAAGALTVRIYHKPLVLLIWLGAIIMAGGGMLSLSDRRLRVGAPRPSRAPVRVVPAE